MTEDSLVLKIVIVGGTAVIGLVVLSELAGVADRFADVRAVVRLLLAALLLSVGVGGLGLYMYLRDSYDQRR